MLVLFLFHFIEKGGENVHIEQVHMKKRKPCSKSLIFQSISCFEEGESFDFSFDSTIILSGKDLMHPNHNYFLS